MKVIDHGGKKTIDVYYDFDTQDELLTVYNSTIVPALNDTVKIDYELYSIVEVICCPEKLTTEYLCKEVDES